MFSSSDFCTVLCTQNFNQNCLIERKPTTGKCREICKMSSISTPSLYYFTWVDAVETSFYGGSQATSHARTSSDCLMLTGDGIDVGCTEL